MNGRVIDHQALTEGVGTCGHSLVDDGLRTLSDSVVTMLQSLYGPYSMGRGEAC